ncbi:MAG: GAF domain-containing protein [Leptolyngbyaceae bacterium]|nr:GAF domain-containing protein [Leptolyngbyaceae bacterium]
MNGQILIVDDNLKNLALLYTTLAEQGYEVRKAISGSMALMGIQASPPDLILLDIRLPDLDGYEVCHRLKASEETSGIPIIFLSAVDDVLDKVKAFSLGAVDYITKPFQVEEVLARVKTQLALRSATQEIARLNETLEHRVAQRTEELIRKNEELQQQIEARHQAEAAQRASEEKLANIMKSLDEVIWSVTPDGSEYLFVSDAVETVYGCTKAYAYEHPQFWKDCIHPDDRERLRPLFQALQQTGVFSAEYRIIRPDGFVRWVSDRGQMIYDSEGVAIRIDGITQDITASKESALALEHQVNQERIVTAISQRIRQSLDLNLILSTTVEEVRQFIQSERVMVFRLNPDWSGEVIFESVADPAFSLLGKTIEDYCFAENYVDAYKHGRMNWIDDAEELDVPECYQQFLNDLNIRANLIVPIVSNEKLWGLLIAQNCSQPRQWQTSEAELLKQLATQVAIAIHQSQLYHHVKQFNTQLEEQVEQRTDELQRALAFEASLNKISEELRDSLDETTIIQTAVEQLSQKLDTWSCDLAIYDLEARQSTVCFESVAEGVSSAQGKVIHFDQDEELYAQLLSGDSLQFCWPRDYSGLVRQFPDAVTILACPIRDERQVMGDLWLFRNHQHAFDASEKRLVQHVATQCAIALRQARLYAASQQQVKVLEQLHRLKDDFLSTVSHELRSPITNIKMALQMLDMSLAQVKPILDSSPKHQSETITQRLDQYLNILKIECNREISLVNDLLDLQRLESGHQELDLAPVDLDCLVLTVAESFQERASSRQQHLTLSISKPLPPILSNADALNRILSELLNNACKYTPPDKEILLTVKPIEHYLEIQIKNFGAEIPPNSLPYIFEKFYRAPNTDRWQQGGTGLGLALVQELVKHLGGTIHVHSEKAFTLFIVQLPIHKTSILYCDCACT